MFDAFQLGTVLDEDLNPSDVPFFVSADELATHFCCNGSTGSGKSKTAEAIGIQAIECGQGYCLVDKHGTTARAIAAHVVRTIWETNDLSLLRRVHYLSWSPFSVPRLDPFHLPFLKDVHPEFRGNALTAAVESTGHQFATHITSATTGTESFEETPRLLRTLNGGLAGCARRAGRLRLPVSLVHVLLDVCHPRHAAVYQRVARILPLDVRADFEALHALENPLRAREQVESALNRLRAFFTSLVKESFGETAETAETFDFEGAISRGEVILVDLGESQYFSHLQGVTLGRLISSTVVEALMRMPAGRRPLNGFYLILEEAGELLNEPFLRYLGAVRKFDCRMMFCGQDLSTYRRPGIDLVPKLLSQCGVAMVYNNRLPADALEYARLLFQGSLKFEKYKQLVQLDDGPEFIQLEDEGINGQHSTTDTKGSGRSKGKTFGTNIVIGESNQEGEQHGQSKQEAIGNGEGSGSSIRKNIVDPQQTDSQQRNKSHTVSNSEQDSCSRSFTNSKQVGESHGDSAEFSESESTAEANSTGWNRTKKWVQIRKIIKEWQETNQLKEGPTAEQIEAFRMAIMELPQRIAIVKKPGAKPVFIRSLDMPNAFATRNAQQQAVEWLQRKMVMTHRYMFVPDLSPEREEERIKTFLTQGNAPSTRRDSEKSDSDDGKTDSLSI